MTLNLARSLNVFAMLFVAVAFYFSWELGNYSNLLLLGLGAIVGVIAIFSPFLWQDEMPETADASRIHTQLTVMALLFAISLPSLFYMIIAK